MPSAGVILLAADRAGVPPGEFVKLAYQRNGRNIAHTARELGVNRGTVRFWLRSLGELPAKDKHHELQP